SASRRTSAGDHEIDGLGALALLVGLDVEADALSFIERLEPGALDRGDVHEHVASTVVGLDEAVAPLAVEELHRTAHCHWEAPFPNTPPRRPSGAAGRPDIHSRGKASAVSEPQSPPPAPIERRNVKASRYKQ